MAPCRHDPHHRRLPTRRCPIDPHDRLDRFRSALGFRADVGDAPGPGIELTGLDGDPIVPAVCLHVDADALAAFSGDPVPDDDPDDDREAARVQTLLALIEEAILTREPGQDHLVLVAGGVRAVREHDVVA